MYSPRPIFPINEIIYFVPIIFRNVLRVNSKVGISILSNLITRVSFVCSKLIYYDKKQYISRTYQRTFYFEHMQLND